MSETDSTDSERNAPSSRAENLILAAGTVTVISGLLTALYVLIVALAGVEAGRVEVAGGVIVGVLLGLLGVLILRSIRMWYLWTAMAVAAILLAAQLWMAYGGGRRPQAGTVSIFALVVPLMVLILNTLAVGAVRALRSKHE